MTADANKEPIQFEQSGKITIAKFNCREITRLESTQNILEKIGDQIELPQFENLLIDFSGVEFAATNAISMLLIILKRVRVKGGDVYLCCLSNPVRNVFDVMQLSKLFEIWPTRQQALAAIEGKK